jgi:hypothetical protein
MKPALWRWKRSNVLRLWLFLLLSSIRDEEVVESRGRPEGLLVSPRIIEMRSSEVESVVVSKR